MQEEQNIITIEDLGKYIEVFEGEHWKPIERYETRYYISDCGRVFSVKHRKLMKPFVTNTGNGKYPANRHLTICLCEDYATEYKKLHSLVAHTFLIKPDVDENVKLEIHHLNGDPSDNSAKNLIWITHQHHMQIHALLRKFNKGLVKFDSEITDKSA